MERSVRKRRVVLLPLIAFTLVAMVAVLAAAVWTVRTPSQRRQGGFLAQLPGLAESATPGQPSAGRLDEVVEVPTETIAAWKTAIVVRDAETVSRLDAAILAEPDKYVDLLKSSALSDGNERVRAFATRELGKFKRLELVPSFERLLTDGSAYVRKNAAWALGELGSQGNTGTAARQTQVELQHIAARDPSDDVRAAARVALDQLRSREDRAR